MAKDDWDLDDDPSENNGLDNFDHEMDFDFDPMDTRDNRKPIVKVASSAAREIASMRSAGKLVKQVAEKALPDGYKNAYSTIKDTKDAVSDIYDTAVKEAEPSIQTLKRLGRLTIPAAEKILPKRIVDKLKSATAKQTEYGTVNRDELEINQTLATIFDAQQKADALAKKEEAVKDKMDLKISKKQFGATLGVNAQTAEGISRLVGYQDNVLAKYHRKSLEIQHRHYFAARELLAFTKKTNEIMVSELRSITKNTALPNEAKIQLNETFKRQAKEKLIGSFQDSSFNLLGNLIGKIKKGANTSVKETMEMLNMMSEMLNMGLDMSGIDSEDQDGFGMDIPSMIGEGIGGMARNKVADMIFNSKAFQKVLKDKRVAGKLQKGDNFLNIITESLPRLVNTKIKTSDSWFWKMLDVFAEGGIGEDRITAKTGLAENAFEPASWDIMSRRTLIEIIPEYLSKMLVELETINRNVPPTQRAARQVWDNDKEGFITTKERSKQLRKKVNLLADTKLNDYANEIISIMGADKVLSEGAIQALKMKLVEMSASMDVFDPRVIAEMGGKYGDEIAAFMEDKYKLSAYEDPNFLKSEGLLGKVKDFAELAKHRAKYFKDSDPKMLEDHMRTSRLFNDLAGRMPDFNSFIRRNSTTGIGGLRDIGLVDKDGGFNYDYKMEMIRKILAGEKLEFHAKGGEAGEGKNTNPNDDDTVATMIKKGEFIIPEHVVKRKGKKFFEDLIVGREAQGNVNKANKFKRSGIDPIFEVYDHINESLRVSVVGDKQERQLELLEMIANSVAHGYVVNSDGTVSQTGYMGQFGKDAKSVMGKGFRALWKGTVTGNKIRNELFGKFSKYVLKPGYNAAMTAGTFAWAHVKDRYELGKEMVTDLYMKGMKSPLLTEAKLKLGHYYYINDKGERVFIKSWDEIKGEAVDIYDVATQSIVVMKTQLQDLYSQTRPKLTTFFRKLRTKAGAAILQQFNLMRTVSKIATEVGNKIYRAITAPCDVYVKGKMAEGPRLRKMLFLNGGYTDTAGNIIDHPDKIAGPIYAMGDNGNVELVLSAEDLRLGIVDSKGDPIDGTGLAGKFINKGKRMVNEATKMAKTLAKIGYGVGKNIGNAALGITGMVASKVPVIGFNSGVEARLDKILRHLRLAFPVTGEDDDLIKEEASGSKASAEMREKAQKLKEEIINRKNRVKEFLKAKRDAVRAKWDTDSDGDVEGSWKDILQKRKEKMKGGFAAGLSAVKDKIPSWKKKPETTPEEKSGLMGRIGDWIMGLLTGSVLKGGGMLGLAKKAVVGSGRLALGAGKLIGKGALGATKLVGKGAWGLTKGLGRFAMTAGRVGAFALATPEILAALTVAAVAGATAYGVSKGLDAARRRRELKPIEKLRFLQYGIPINNKDAVVQVRYLEERIVNRIQLKPDGGFKVEFEWADIWDEFHSDFGCEEKDVPQQARFRSWFYYRFLPVFIWHMRAAKRIEKLSVFDVDDKMTPKLKQEYVKEVQFGSKEAEHLRLDPYAIMDSPFKEYALQETADSVQQLSLEITRASKDGKNIDDDKNKKVSQKEKLKEDANKVVKDTSVGGFLKSTFKRALGIDKDTDYLRDKNQAEREDERRLANAKAKSQARQRGIALSTKDYDYSQKPEQGLKEQFNSLINSGQKATPKLLFPTIAAKVNSPFGTRDNPFNPNMQKDHKGIDIQVPAGSPVYAAASGRVVQAGVLDGYGLCIYIQHDDGTSTRYGHLTALMAGITVGSMVRAGQQIAFSGGIPGLRNSGKSTGPHLHFEYRDADASSTSNSATPLNPIAYFKGIDKDNVNQVVSNDTGKAKSDMGKSSLLPTPPKATTGQNATINTASATPTSTSNNINSNTTKANVASNGAVATGGTTVHVAPPNLDPLNKTLFDSSKVAGDQRDKQIALLEHNNALLTSIATQMSQQMQNQNMANQNATSKTNSDSGTNKVNSVVDLSIGA